MRTTEYSLRRHDCDTKWRDIIMAEENKIVIEGQPNGGAHQTETMIPKYRFDEVSRRAQEAEAKIAELQAKVDTLATKDKEIEDLKKQVQDITQGYELEKINAKKNDAIDLAIKGKVVDIEVVKSLLDMEKITVDEKGKVQGLNEQLKNLQASKAYLWKPAQPVVQPSSQGPTIEEKTFAQKMAEKKKALLGVTQKSKNYFL